MQQKAAAIPSSASPILIDCDPGVDDAVMLILALCKQDLDVRAITTVAGNVPLELTCRNARMLTDLMDRTDIPVHAGCIHAMRRMPVTAEDFHGETGIAGIEPFEPKTPIASQHAIGAIVSASQRAGPKGLTLIITGPMTNVAFALSTGKFIRENIKELIIMGGADAAGGNITPMAEFNIFADPHAAKIVFDAGLPTRILSLDVTHQVRAEDRHLTMIEAVDSPHARLMLDLLHAANTLEARWKAGQRAPMHDPSTLIALIRPELFTGRRGTVSVDVDSHEESDRFWVAPDPPPRFGQTRFTPDPDGPHLWYDTVDEDAFFKAIAERVKPE